MNSYIVCLSIFTLSITAHPHLMSLPPTLSIFVIDDDDDDRFLTQKAFQTDLPATQVYAVASGQQAFELFGSLEALPSVMLLDLNMPRMNGFEVLAQLKQSARYQSIPVFILTTSQAAADQERAKELGAEALITKPTSYAGLVSVAQRIRLWWLAGLTG
ncbi:response regulator [Spirosoma validum]|uniref:Response regulator n=1 Tax=Spirosoma validum TaxID=2771355 RepID=A0A927B9K6_9BACT|nr:response regulator [Spirosoma validum]MBD2757697.1 response regulator [Spirosoma validum]